MGARRLPASAPLINGIPLDCALDSVGLAQPFPANRQHQTSAQRDLRTKILNSDMPSLLPPNKSPCDLSDLDLRITYAYREMDNRR